jgi:LPXTG-motif cell wall-anchored protein
MLTDVPIPLADVPQTGSNPLLNLWWMLLALSGLGILVVARKRPVNH